MTSPITNVYDGTTWIGAYWPNPDEPHRDAFSYMLQDRRVYSHPSEDGAKHMIRKQFHKLDVLDATDRGIRMQCQFKRNNLTGPLTGDILRFSNGTERRIAQMYEDCFQPTATDRPSFGLDPKTGRASMSGGLDTAISLTRLRPTAAKAPAQFWFFSHGRVRAFNGVNVELDVNVWEVID